MAGIDENQMRQDGRVIMNYLLRFYAQKLPKDKAVEKINKLLEKLAGKLGMSTGYNILTGNFPVTRLASFTTGYLKLFWMEGYYTANPNLNPYDPTKNEDEYAEYLLYSWARGRPGYQYFDVAAAWNPNYQRK